MKNEIIEQVKGWISEFVIGLNLCPFAKHPFEKGNIHYVVVKKKEDNQILSIFETEVENLSKGEESTSLIILEDQSISFLEYLRIFELCEQSLKVSGHDEDFQLASFHPDYQFADSDYSDQSNFSNRSPFPIIHILRTAEVRDAINSFGDTSLIYKRNIETLESLSIEKLNSLIKS